MSMIRAITTPRTDIIITVVMVHTMVLHMVIPMKELLHMMHMDIMVDIMVMDCMDMVIMDTDTMDTTIHILHTLNMIAPTMLIMPMGRNMAHTALITMVMITINPAEVMIVVNPLTVK